jgi:hypothetical protein
MMAISNLIRCYFRKGVYYCDVKVNHTQVHLNMKQLTINLIFAAVVTATVFHRQIVKSQSLAANKPTHSQLISDRWYDMVDN